MVGVYEPTIAGRNGLAEKLAPSRFGMQTHLCREGKLLTIREEGDVCRSVCEKEILLFRKETCTLPFLL